MNFQLSLTLLIRDSGLSLLTVHGLWIPPVPRRRAKQDFSSFLRIFFLHLLIPSGLKEGAKW